MPWSASNARLLLLLGAIALAIYVGAALFLPNPEQDAYSYVEIITGLTAKIAAGDLHLRDLFGFWLPLYPVIAALVNTVVHQPLVVGKIVSAVFGAVSAVLVFVATLRLTSSRPLALVAYAIVVTRPLYLLYSAASMTDAPNVCFVTAVMVCALHRRWLLAALCAAAAESIRLESWVFVVLLPFLQILCQRRVSLGAVVIVLLPPALWLLISHAGTGDWLGYFNKRAQYQSEYIEFFSSRRHFAADDVMLDLRYFIAGANPIIFLAVIAGGAWSFWQLVRERAREFADPIIAALISCAIIGFFVIAYSTKRQPVILPRYAFALFTCGLPLLAWFLRRLPYAPLVLLVTLWPLAGEIGTVRNVIGDDRAQRQIAQAVRTALEEPGTRCFTDDPAVRVLSNLPSDHFLRTEDVPRQFRNDAASFAAYLHQERVGYLIYYAIENSLAVKFFPNDSAEKIAQAESPFGPAVALYRLHKNLP